jgi:hypothetical protein
MKIFLLAVLLPSIALGETTEERVTALEARVKALEAKLAAPSVGLPASAPTDTQIVSKDSPIELVDFDYSYEIGQYGIAHYKIAYVLKNKTDKTITLNHSTLEFRDLLGESIANFTPGADLKLPPGKPVTDIRYYQINQFIPSQQRLRGVSKENIKRKLSSRRQSLLMDRFTRGNENLQRRTTIEASAFVCSSVMGALLVAIARQRN